MSDDQTRVRPTLPVAADSRTMMIPRLSLATDPALKPAAIARGLTVMHLPIRAIAFLLVLVGLTSSSAGGETVEKKTGSPSTASNVAPPETFTAEQREHWAYQPLGHPSPPSVRERDWPRNPIDRFILAELEAVDLAHSPPADKVALIRRLTYDLTGLPPRPEDRAAFLADNRPDAYDRAVDRLLRSPQHGVRWAQHWLDLAHYADTNGFELDAERPDAWRYRDWVVKSLNADMPYDRFAALQLAGDELRPGDVESLIATGFGRSGPRELVGGNVIPEEKRQTELAEITATVGSVFFGLTIGCARCHDHKFDAIPTTDYYRLQSFFAASELVDLPIATKAETRAYDVARTAIEQKAAPLRARMAKLEAPYRRAISDRKNAMLTAREKAVLATPEKDRTAEEKRLAKGLLTSLRVTWEEVAAEVEHHPADYAARERLKREIDAIEKTLPRPPAHAMALVDDKSSAPDMFVLRRGDFRNKGTKVHPRPPGVLLASQRPGSYPPEAIRPLEGKTGRRAALARWLTSPDNPLIARVIVNRLWQHHFGRGLVATPSDFGVRGEPPSHPELLDWLASELISGGWRLKPIHRLMVTSSTYRQTSRANARLVKDDPDNALLGRMNRRRLDAEGLRDAMLTASGELNYRLGGPGVLAPLEKEVKDLIFTEAEVIDLWPVDADPSEHLRRSLYLYKKRNVRYPLLESFDAPDNQTACPRRETSTHALQALNLVNSEFASGRARGLATRILRESAPTPEARVRKAYQLVLAREPRPEEIVRTVAFLGSQAAMLKGEFAERAADQPGSPCCGPGLNSPEDAAWADFALALLNCNEFLYVP